MKVRHISLVDRWSERIQELQSRQIPQRISPGVATGFVTWTRSFGFQPGDPDIVAGRPSMGKTALRVEHRRERRSRLKHAVA